MIALIISAPASANDRAWRPWYAAASERRHRAADDVAVTSRTDDAVDDRGYSWPVTGELADELDGPSVHGREADGVVPESGAPIQVRTPGRCVDHDPEAEPLGQIEVWGVVADECCSTRLGVELRKSGEVGQIDPFTEDEGRLEAAVGDVGAPGCQLGGEVGAVMAVPFCIGDAVVRRAAGVRRRLTL